MRRPAPGSVLGWALGWALMALPAAAQGVPAPGGPPQGAPPQAAAANVDHLLDLLKVAPDEQTAGALEEAIRGQWFAQASPAVRLLLSRGARNLNDNHPKDALEDFDAALDLDPSLVAGWEGRAQARAALGDTVGAERDIAETIRRDPRQFAALEDLSRIAEQRGDWRGAYDAWSRALDLDPKAPGGQDRLKDLKRRAFGDET